MKLNIKSKKPHNLMALKKYAFNVIITTTIYKHAITVEPWRSFYVSIVCLTLPDSDNYYY